MSDTQKQNTVDAGQKVETEEITVDTEQKVETTENTDTVSTSVFTVSNIETKHAPTERSVDEILRIFNKRRPYCPNDFKRQSFIPDLRHLFDEKQR